MALRLLCDEAVALAIIALCPRPTMQALYRVSVLWARAVQAATQRDAADIPHLRFLPWHVPCPMFVLRYCMLLDKMGCSAFVEGFKKVYIFFLQGLLPCQTCREAGLWLAQNMAAMK